MVLSLGLGWVLVVLVRSDWFGFVVSLLWWMLGFYLGLGGDGIMVFLIVEIVVVDWDV